MQVLKPLPISGFDHLEFYVGNARQAAYYYQRAFSLRPTAYAGPETGLRDRASYVLESGDVRFVFTTALRPDGPIGRHALLHGDGVRDVALTVEDAEACYREALHRGAQGIQEPTTVEDDHGLFRRAAIAAYGDTVHSFIERSEYRGPFAPGFQALSSANGTPDIHLAAIDHVVGNVEEGRMEQWVAFYERVFGFTRLVSFDDKDITTEYSALRSIVMQHPQGAVKLPINEPAPGRRKSQIREYLDYYGSPGVQHIALRTKEIIPTVAAMRRQGVRFLDVPATYYDDLGTRVGPIAEPLDDLRPLGILADRDDKGYLLQIFTEPVEDRPTLFFEVIQRAGSESFGKGNFKALFEAVEREQARRGNL